MVKYVLVEFSASDEVPIYRLPPWDDKNQCLALAAADMSEIVKKALEVEATCKSHQGEVVPMPRRE
jgi:hypothetical protein